MAREYKELTGEIGELLDETGSFLGCLVEAPSPAGGGSRAQVLMDQQLQMFYDSYYQLRSRAKEHNLTVAVLALTKSGKSTLLNALMGANLLPANNVPETARIVRITHASAGVEETPVLFDSHSPNGIRGDQSIRSYLQYLNEEVRARSHSTSDEEFVDLHVPVAALTAAEDDAGAEGGEGVTLQLLDTPGPNEAGEEALRFQVERLLDSVDAVIYLLDYTKLKTAEEAGMLRKLKDINPQLVRRLSSRLFFVVNKADVMRTVEGLGPEETKEYVAHLVTRQLQDEGFQLEPEQVLLLSARESLLSRLILLNKASHEDVAKFGKMAFGHFGAARRLPEEYAPAAREMLAGSGLPELEAAVLGFLFRRAGGLKLLAVVDDLSRMLSWVRNVALASRAALQQDVAVLHAEALQLQHELDVTMGHFSVVQREAELIEAEVVDEVQARMQRLRESLFAQVAAALSPLPSDSNNSVDPTSAAAGSSSGSAIPEGSAAPSSLRAGWQAVWAKAVRVLGRQPASASEDAHQELLATLQELHSDIHVQIEAEVAAFWNDLEAATNEKQRAMLRGMNRQLEALSRRIEGAVAAQLDIRLEPVHIALTPPTRQQFHSSLQDLFVQGIQEREVVATSEREEQYVVWERRSRRSGLCRVGDYYVGRPATRTVQDRTVTTVYELQPAKIQEHFVGLVSSLVDASVHSVRAFVHQYLAARIAEARDALAAYGQRYQSSMAAALEVSRQGGEQHKAAIAVVAEQLRRLDGLVARAAMLQAHVEASVDAPPIAAAPGAVAQGSVAQGAEVSTGAVEGSGAATGEELRGIADVMQQPPFLPGEYEQFVQTMAMGFPVAPEAEMPQQGSQRQAAMRVPRMPTPAQPSACEPAVSVTELPYWSMPISTELVPAAPVPVSAALPVPMPVPVPVPAWPQAPAWQAGFEDPARQPLPEDLFTGSQAGDARQAAMGFPLPPTVDELLAAAAADQEPHPGAVCYAAGHFLDSLPDVDDELTEGSNEEEAASDNAEEGEGGLAGGDASAYEDDVIARELREWRDELARIEAGRDAPQQQQQQDAADELFEDESEAEEEEEYWLEEGEEGEYLKYEDSVQDSYYPYLGEGGPVQGEYEEVEEDEYEGEEEGGDEEDEYEEGEEGGSALGESELAAGAGVEAGDGASAEYSAELAEAVERAERAAHACHTQLASLAALHLQDPASVPINSVFLEDSITAKTGEPAASNAEGSSASANFAASAELVSDLGDDDVPDLVDVDEEDDFSRLSVWVNDPVPAACKPAPTHQADIPTEAPPSEESETVYYPAPEAALPDSTTNTDPAPAAAKPAANPDAALTGAAVASAAAQAAAEFDEVEGAVDADILATIRAAEAEAAAEAAAADAAQEMTNGEIVRGILAGTSALHQLASSSSSVAGSGHGAGGEEEGFGGESAYVEALEELPSRSGSPVGWGATSGQEEEEAPLAGPSEDEDWTVIDDEDREGDTAKW